MARNIRLNNAGNLKAPDEATGRRYWGKYGFTGLDEDGFAMFDTAAGGRAALEQQIRIDQGRDQTQKEFINKTSDPVSYLAIILYDIKILLRKLFCRLV